MSECLNQGRREQENIKFEDAFSAETVLVIVH